MPRAYLRTENQHTRTLFIIFDLNEMQPQASRGDDHYHLHTER